VGLKYSAIFTSYSLIALVPDNGLCVFVGTVLNEEGKEKKLSFALEPFKPINT